MTLLRASWETPTRIYNTSKPVFCAGDGTTATDTWFFDTTTLVSGRPVIGSTCTGTGGNVLTIKSPTLTNGTIAGNFGAPKLCGGRDGVELFSASTLWYESASRLINGNYAWTLTLSMLYEPSNIVAFAGGIRIAWGKTDVVGLVTFLVPPYIDFLGINANDPAFAFAQGPGVSTLGAVCGTGEAFPPQPIITANTCFTYRLSVDPCQHRLSVKCSGETNKVNWPGFAKRTNICVEMLRTSTVLTDAYDNTLTPIDGGPPGLFPNYMSYNDPANRLRVKATNPSFWLYSMSIAPGYQTC